MMNTLAYSLVALTLSATVLVGSANAQGFFNNLRNNVTNAAAQTVNSAITNPVNSAVDSVTGRTNQVTDSVTGVTNTVNGSNVAETPEQIQQRKAMMERHEQVLAAHREDFYKRYNITEDQQEELNTIREDAREDGIAIHQDIRAKRQELRSYLITSDANLESAMDRRDGIAQLQEELAELRLETLLDIKDVISPEAFEGLLTMTPEKQGLIRRTLGNNVPTGRLGSRVIGQAPAADAPQPGVAPVIPAPHLGGMNATASALIGF